MASIRAAGAGAAAGGARRSRRRWQCHGGAALGSSHRAEALRDHADELGMGEIDLRIDHRDRDIGAPDHAVDVQHLELLEDILRGVALLLGRIAPRRRGLLGLVQCVDVVRLHDRGHADIIHRSIAAAGVLPSVIFRRTTVDPELYKALRCDDRQAEPSNCRLQPVGVTLVAICTTTSSWIRRVSVAGGYPRPCARGRAGFAVRRQRRRRPALPRAAAPAT